jgi:hypothetical protein
MSSTPRPSRATRLQATMADPGDPHTALVDVPPHAARFLLWNGGFTVFEEDA